VELQTVVVVTGAVVGVVYVVVGVLFFTVVVVPWRTVVGVVFTVVVVTPFLSVVVVAPARVVVVVAAGIEVVVVGVVVVVLTALASAVTRTADITHDPRKIIWVKRRTRAKRRSRCWGVRSVGTIGFLCLYSLAAAPKQMTGSR
jgi:hypothetical protein